MIVPLLERIGSRSSGLAASNTSQTVSPRRNEAAGVADAKENVRRRPSLSLIASTLPASPVIDAFAAASGAFIAASAPAPGGGVFNGGGAADGGSALGVSVAAFATSSGFASGCISGLASGFASDLTSTLASGFASALGSGLASALICGAGAWAASVFGASEAAA